MNLVVEPSRISIGEAEGVVKEELQKKRGEAKVSSKVLVRAEFWVKAANFFSGPKLRVPH